MAQLTDAAVARLKIPPGKIVFDAQLQGFGVRGLSDGRKSWVVQKRLGSQHVRKVIGDTAVMPAKQARAEAQALLGAIGKGEDPRTEELRKPGTVLELTNEYLAVGEKRKGGKLSPRTKVELRRYLLKYWKPLHRLQLVEVTRRTITQQARAIAKDKGGVTGNRAFVALSAMLSWGAREGWLDANPAINANLPFGEEKARDRVLSPDELAAIWRAAGDESLGLFGPIARLLLALPLRRSEIGGLRADEVDLDQRLIKLPAERCKNRRPHTIPINELAVQVLRTAPTLDGDTLFGGTRGGLIGFRNWATGSTRLNALLQAAGTPVENWTLHDFRRTCATRLGDLGVLPHVVECLLAHVSGFRAGVAGTYNRARYMDDMTEAMTRWAGYINACLTGATERYIESLRPPQAPAAPVTELHAHRT